ncbi:hypothetical protein BDN71DRAFT_1511024 [Pleurotus eryngii]|uniref:SAM domain-containing protein n=1 Tax=Pleurotus eryngii TaxID=5323 RepID=A0A9P6DCT4_PLEER|nr:hypothetical protein BDN71DRAFT_1511024 [Pleurotus eryngii]
MTFSTFLSDVADWMDTQLTLLTQIGYIPSYKPKSSKPSPKLLEDEEGWIALIEDVWTYIITCRAKYKGKGIVKAFMIILIDTSGIEVKDGSFKKSSSLAKQNDAKPAPALLKAHELLNVIEKKHMCADHKKPCLVWNDGTHYKFTTSDLAKWAHLASIHRANIDEPPNELNLTDSIKHQKTAKKMIAESEPPLWIQQMMGVVMGGMVARNNNAVNSSTPRSLLSWSQDGHPPCSPGLRQPYKCATTSSPIDYPDVTIWLDGLESNPACGWKQSNYTRYGAALAEHDIDDLSNLVRLKPEKLEELGGMTHGMANRLLSFAMDDIQVLQEHGKFARLE